MHIVRAFMIFPPRNIKARLIMIMVLGYTVYVLCNVMFSVIYTRYCSLINIISLSLSLAFVLSLSLCLSLSLSLSLSDNQSYQCITKKDAVLGLLFLVCLAFLLGIWLLLYLYSLFMCACAVVCWFFTGCFFVCLLVWFFFWLLVCLLAVCVFVSFGFLVEVS